MSIIETSRRETVQAHFPDDQITLEAPVGTRLDAFLAHRPFPTVQGQIVVAALKNGKLRELSHRLENDAEIHFITSGGMDGARIYRRSLCFLLVAAAAEVLPDDTIVIHHSMPFGGYYCERDSQQPLTEAERQAVLARMQALVAADQPINQVQVPLEEALQIFRQSGDAEKAKLFLRRRKDYLTLYELNGVRDYFHGFMVPRTSYLPHFAIYHYNQGFILQFPRRHAPHELQPLADEARLAGIFHDYKEWLDIMGVPTVLSLNETLTNGRLREVVLTAEALHAKQLSQIAYEIDARDTAVRLVLISGPTSAGKTTFSKRLAIQLMAQGRIPITIGMDNYFVNRADTPLDADGKYDFEALQAVDVPLFRQHLSQLMSGQEIIQPVYNFHTGEREWGEPLRITPQHVILIEGIHGLNPALVAGLPSDEIFRVFIAAFTQLNLDKHNRIPTTDTRLLRRIVRDAAHRGYTAADTIGRWQSVRRGEKKHIFPYQINADIFFNSALVYELAALKRLAYPLLLQVEPGTAERVEANRLMAFLQWFDPIPAEALAYIPNDSILREFIGGSVLDAYEPGQVHSA